MHEREILPVRRPRQSTFSAICPLHHYLGSSRRSRSEYDLNRLLFRLRVISFVRDPFPIGGPCRDP